MAAQYSPTARVATTANCQEVDPVLAGPQGFNHSNQHRQGNDGPGDGDDDLGEQRVVEAVL